MKGIIFSLFCGLGISGIIIHLFAIGEDNIVQYVKTTNFLLYSVTCVIIAAAILIHERRKH